MRVCFRNCVFSDLEGQSSDVVIIRTKECKPALFRSCLSLCIVISALRTTECLHNIFTLSQQVGCFTFYLLFCRFRRGGSICIVLSSCWFAADISRTCREPADRYVTCELCEVFHLREDRFQFSLCNKLTLLAVALPYSLKRIHTNRVVIH